LQFRVQLRKICTSLDRSDFENNSRSAITNKENVSPHKVRVFLEEFVSDFTQHQYLKWDADSYYGYVPRFGHLRNFRNKKRRESNI